MPMENGLEADIEDWKDKYLSPFCLDGCVDSCCTRHTRIRMNREQVKEAYGIEDTEELIEAILSMDMFPSLNNPGMFEVPTHNGPDMPHCIAYNPKTKKCKLQHNKPRDCRIFPVYVSKGVTFFPKCEFPDSSPEAIEALAGICEEHSVSLYIGDKPVIG